MRRAVVLDARGFDRLFPYVFENVVQGNGFFVVAMGSAAFRDGIVVSDENVDQLSRKDGMLSGALLERALIRFATLEKNRLFGNDIIAIYRKLVVVQPFGQILATSVDIRPFEFRSTLSK